MRVAVVPQTGLVSAHTHQHKGHTIDSNMRTVALTHCIGAWIDLPDMHTSCWIAAQIPEAVCSSREM